MNVCCQFNSLSFESLLLSDGNCRDEGPNYILGLGPWPRTWGDLRTNKR